MSVADTAEYQLQNLAEVLTELSKKSAAGNAPYAVGYRQALADVAREMCLGARVEYTYP